MLVRRIAPLGDDRALGSEPFTIGVVCLMAQIFLGDALRYWLRVLVITLQLMLCSSDPLRHLLLC